VNGPEQRVWTPKSNNGYDHHHLHTAPTPSRIA
jgi:hypothetical protein